MRRLTGPALVGAAALSRERRKPAPSLRRAHLTGAVGVVVSVRSRVGDSRSTGVIISRRWQRGEGCSGGCRCAREQSARRARGAGDTDTAARRSRRRRQHDEGRHESHDEHDDAENARESEETGIRDGDLAETVVAISCHANTAKRRASPIRVAGPRWFQTTPARRVTSCTLSPERRGRLGRAILATRSVHDE